MPTRVRRNYWAAVEAPKAALKPSRFTSLVVIPLHVCRSLAQIVTYIRKCVGTKTDGTLPSLQLTVIGVEGWLGWRLKAYVIVNCDSISLKHDSVFSFSFLAVHFFHTGFRGSVSGLYVSLHIILYLYRSFLFYIILCQNFFSHYTLLLFFTLFFTCIRGFVLISFPHHNSLF